MNISLSDYQYQYDMQSPDDDEHDKYCECDTCYELNNYEEEEE